MTFRLFLFLLPLWLHGAALLDTSVYERENRVDLLFSFDKPFLGSILTQEKGGDLYLKLTQVTGKEEPKPLALTSSFIRSADYFFSGDELYLHVQAEKGVGIQADKTADGYGIRIRLLNPDLPPEKEETEAKPIPAPAAQKPAKLGENRPDMGSRYVAAALFVTALLTVYALFRLLQRRSRGGWLFSGSEKKKPEINVITQRIVDAKNRITLIQYNGMNYLVLVGATNLVIDKFPMTGAKAEKRFGELLKDSESRLDAYLTDDDRMLERYKRKASRQTQAKPMGKTS